MALTGCITFSILLGLVPSIIVLGIVAIKPLSILIGIVIGYVSIPWNNLKNKITNWVFKRKENKLIKKNDLKVERKRYQKQKLERKFENLNNQVNGIGVDIAKIDNNFNKFFILFFSFKFIYFHINYIK